MTDPTPTDCSRIQPVIPATPPHRSRLGAPLPSPLTSLVGRRDDVQQVRSLLHREDVRLVTLIGPGGVGKTRLALEVAADVADTYADGVVFVPLAAIADPALVLPAVARALEIPESGGPLMQRLTGALRLRKALLVLDNFEHVIGTAPFIADVLTACPQLRVLVTSRAPLRVSGEHEVPVPPLAVPDPGRPPPLPELAGYGAVALFVQRARAVRLDFAITEDNAGAVTELCARLDGLPLAIELAAARSKVLSPQAILARVEHRLDLLTGGGRDQPDRLRTMREVIAWSYDLLTPPEQMLFRRLAVFASGWSIEAASAVAFWDNDPGPTTLDGLSALTDCSLLLQQQQADGEPRFTMLETIREYGLERLVAAGEEEETRRRHATWYLEAAEAFWPTLQRQLDPTQAISHLAPEHDNLRAALAWLDSTGDDEGLLRLAGAIFLYWYGDLREGLSWLDREALHGVETSAAVRARAMLGAGMLAHYAADDSRAVPWLKESLALYRTIEDRWGMMFALMVLGIVAEDSGDYDEAAPRFTESLEHARVVENPVVIGLTLVHLGVVAWGQGDRDRAIAFVSEALVVQRVAGDLASRGAESLAFLGLFACEHGDFRRSVEYQRESLSLHLEMGYREVLAANLANVAMLAGAVQWPDEAARLFGAAVGQREAIGNPFKLPERAVYDRAIGIARVSAGDDAFAAAWDTGRALSLTEAAAEAFTVLDEIERRVAPGGPSLPPASTDLGDVAGLTAREREVLRLLAGGRTNREIANALFVSPRTVQAHLASIFAKLGIHTRAAAVARAYELGLA
jgi:predicted ATPase/DNA-binding CsgD family transcriptional regulator